SGDGAGLYQGQHLEFVDHSRAPTAVDRLLGPFTDVHIPQRTIVRGDRGNSAQHIERTATIGEGAEQTLALRIVAAGGSVDGQEETLDGAECAVVIAHLDILQSLGEGGAFERRRRFDRGLCAQIEHWLCKTKPGGETQCNGRGEIVRAADIDRYDLIMDKLV